MRWTKPARRCPTEHARRWDSETALRATRRGTIDPKDRQGPGVSRNSVRKHLRSPQVPRARPRPPRGSKLDPFKGYIRQRLGDGLDNCVVLLRELRAQGYTGGYSILKEYVHPFRRRHQPDATMRFETEPGEQAQVDWGSFSYVTEDGHKRQVWDFVMVLSWRTPEDTGSGSRPTMSYVTPPLSSGRLHDAA